MKLHYYCIVYKGILKDENVLAEVNSFVARDTPTVPLRVLDQLKDEAGLREDAVVLNVCNLGYMEEKQFLEGRKSPEEEAPEPATIYVPKQKKIIQ